MRVWPNLSLALATLVLGACDFRDLGSSRETCVDDSECGALDACLLGVCVDPRQQRLDIVHLEIRPPEGSGMRPQQRLDVDVGPESAEARVHIALRETVVARGSIVDESAATVGAQVVAVPTRGIPGRALVSSSSSNGPMGGFSLPLVATDSQLLDDAYRVTIVPDESHVRPPFYLDEDVRPAVAGGVPALARVQLPSPDRLPTCIGRLRSAPAGEGPALPLYEVRALLGGRRISSVGLSDAEGRFSLVLPADVAERVTFELKALDPEAAAPTFRFDDVAWSTDVELDLGPLPEPVRTPGRVIGPGGQAVARARVFARRDERVGNRWRTLRTSVLTADDGTFELFLRPGRYDIAVVPAADAEIGLWTGSHLVPAGVAGASVLAVLPERRLDLQGTVSSAEGLLLEGAALRVTRISGVGTSAGEPLESVEWSFETRTDASGTFSLQVDAGRYRVVVQPDPALGLPRETRVLDIVEPRYNEELTLLPQAFVAGQVTFAEEPVAGAQIIAFSSIVDEDGEPFELGSAIATEGGLFEIVVPDLARDRAGFAAFGSARPSVSPP